MSGANPQYTRRWSICRSFAANANCTRGASCKYNHSLIDTTRIVSLVGHVSQLSFSSSYTSATTSAQPSEQTLFLIEYTKYSAQADLSSSLTDAGALWWRMRLCGGGRATLDAGAESVSDTKRRL
ncbi:hypothetical protein BC835DRAFT_10031 [Cytidiella melzeri]|nr:hypothetical protein BC835DRAFT_10031 [Cytidiella melzeri]